MKKDKQLSEKDKQVSEAKIEAYKYLLSSVQSQIKTHKQGKGELIKTAFETNTPEGKAIARHTINEFTNKYLKEWLKKEAQLKKLIKEEKVKLRT